MALDAVALLSFCDYQPFLVLFHLPKLKLWTFLTAEALHSFISLQSLANTGNFLSLNLAVLDTSYKWTHIVFVLSFQVCFHLSRRLPGPSAFLLHSLKSWGPWCRRPSVSLLCCGCCEQCCCGHTWTLSTFWVPASAFLERMPRSRLSQGKSVFNFLRKHTVFCSSYTLLQQPLHKGSDLPTSLPTVVTLLLFFWEQ